MLNVKCSLPRGFTLIELLVVIVILSIIAGVSSSIFLSVIRSNNKANIINEIQQNGNIIMQTLEASLRNARSVTDPTASEVNTPSAALTYLDKLNNTVSYRFNSGKIQKQVADSSCALPPCWEDINNANQVMGVEVRDFPSSYFKLLTANPQSLEIVLVLRQGINAPGRIDYQAETAFRTVVSLRDY